MLFSRNIFVLLQFIMSGFCFSIFAQDDGKNLFNNTFLHQIKFESSTISGQELWETLTDSYTMVKMTVDGVIVDSVGVRRKGFTSGASLQKPLKIDINEFVSTKKFDGLKKFNLNNNFKDDYLQRENLAYELYRRAGLPSPRTSYAEVYFGENFAGLYSVVEQIDKTFLGLNFPGNDGSLIKAEPPGIVPGTMLEVKEGTMDEFNAFRNNANSSNIGSYVHLRNYLKQMAIDIIIEDWDGYAYNRHNFYVYYEKKTGLLNFINYDHNYSFAVEDPNKCLYPIATFPLTKNLLEDPIFRMKYEQTLCGLMNYLLDPDFILNETNRNYNLIRSNSHGIKAKDPGTLVDYIANRKRWLQDTLTALNIICSNLSFPPNAHAIVINEFVASNDEIYEPGGNGTPDWIELYNNSSNDILLNENYYLSNDKNFPKKWYFPGQAVIPANGYLIIWADKDVHQQGIHAGFKLEKDGGDLLMTYENMENIQSISYSQQFKDMGFARVPNGTGQFVIQSYTFSSNNEEATGMEDIKTSDFLLYPNPARDYISVHSMIPIDYITIHNITGERIRYVKNPSFPLAVKDLKSGIYIIEIAAGQLKQNQKLILY